MGSTRLPEKVLKDIAGKTMLSRVVDRTRLATQLDEVVVATSTESQDDAIANYCDDHDIEYVRGSETDVLDRYHQAARTYDIDHVVRVTSDCPLISPVTIDRAVRLYRARDDEYVTNTLYYTYPDGLDVEVFPFSVLQEAQDEASTEKEREHVTPYMRDGDRFDVSGFENPLDIWAYDYTEEDVIPRWTVDYPEDLKFVQKVYDHLTTPAGRYVTEEAVHELLEREPPLREVNDDRTRENYHIETLAQTNSDE
jgi:spore coat polysaccharide biosynthesis protein SpsF (cytidylyltransferase family)